MTDQLERFIQDLQCSADENRQLFLGTVKALAAAIDGKDPYTRGHSERVSRVSVAIAQRLELSDEECEKISVSALASRRRQDRNRRQHLEEASRTD